MLAQIVSRHAIHRQQRGQMLIGTMFALVILSLLLVSWAGIERRHIETQSADAQGAASAQFGIGVRGYLAAAQAGSITMSSNPLIVTGVNWLKAPSCGGLAGNPTQGFVPCGFTGGSYGAAFNTTVTKNVATNLIQSSTWFMVYPLNGESKSSAALQASRITSATLAQQTPPSAGMFFDVYANAAIGATSAPTPSAITPANTGRIVMFASNAPSNDIWLRVDGTNQMLADLNMGGSSIKNAKDGSFAGSVRVQGTEEIDNGLSVTNGAADLRGGVISPDVELTSVGHMASQALYNMQVMTGQSSYNVSKPDCSKANDGTSQPSIYVALQGTGTPRTNGADALYESHVDVIDAGSSWNVQPKLHTTTYSLSGTSSGGNLVLNLNKSVQAENGTDAVLLVMTKCR